MQVRALQGDTVDLLCWRHLGVTSGVVEQTLQLNHGLVSHGPVIPEGLTVILPDLPTSTAAPQADTTIKLWD